MAKALVVARALSAGDEELLQPHHGGRSELRQYLPRDRESGAGELDHVHLHLRQRPVPRGARAGREVVAVPGVDPGAADHSGPQDGPEQEGHRGQRVHGAQHRFGVDHVRGGRLGPRPDPQRCHTSGNSEPVRARFAMLCYQTL